jgi:excisionase family DNA binding protein
MLTVDQVAEHLAISTKTVRRWIADGRLNAHQIGRQLRISERDLQVFVAQQRR